MGRPKGYSVLNGREKELEKYINLGLNKTSVSKLMGVSRGALYNYFAKLDEFNKEKNPAPITEQNPLNWSEGFKEILRRHTGEVISILREDDENLTGQDAATAAEWNTIIILEDMWRLRKDIDKIMVSLGLKKAEQAA